MGKAGRPKGSKSRKRQRLDRAIEKLDITPLEYMLQVMQNKNADPHRRDEMAKSAAPYLHARRAPEDKAGKTIPPMIYVHPSLEDDGSDGEERP